MTEKLSPCPFCGNAADYESLESGRWSVGCPDGPDGDYCMGFQSLTSFPTKAMARDAWNRRAPQGMETRQGGDSEAAPSRSDDSPVGHQADAPETVAAPIPVEVIEADRALMYALDELSPYADDGDYLKLIAAHRLTFSRGVDEVRGVARRFVVEVKDSVPDDQLIESIAFTAGDYRALARVLSTIEEPRG